MSKNIAICLSGEPKNFNICLKPLNILRDITENSDINVHVFFHLWDTYTTNLWPQLKYNINDFTCMQGPSISEVFDSIKPAAGIYENKNTIDNKIKTTFDYLHKKLKDNIKPRGLLKSKLWQECLYDYDKFNKMVKHTNQPPLSQIISLFECQLLKEKYEKENNIKYDLTIRTRPDIEFFYTTTPWRNKPLRLFNKKPNLGFTVDNIDKLFKAKSNMPVEPGHEKEVQFPELECTKDKEPRSRAAFFVFNSTIDCADYFNKILKLMFYIKENQIWVQSDHEIIPRFFYQSDYTLLCPVNNLNFQKYNPKDHVRHI